MNSELTSPAASVVGHPIDRPRHGDILRHAVAPLRARKDWQAAIDAAYDASTVVRRDGAGELIVLKHPLTPEYSFGLGLEADEHLEKLPPNEIIQAALDQIEAALTVKPTIESYHLLIGVLLDGLCIKAGDDVDGYIDGLGYLLEDVAPSRVERGFKPPRWIPIPALAAAVEELLRTYRATYGKPPPNPDVIDLCARFRIQLLQFQNLLITVWNTRQSLVEINNGIAASDDDVVDDDSEPVDDEDWGF
jgi:hypothetical protein